MLNNPDWKPAPKQETKSTKINLYLPNYFSPSEALNVLDKAKCYKYTIIYTNDPTKHYTYEFI